MWSSPSIKLLLALWNSLQSELADKWQKHQVLLVKKPASKLKERKKAHMERKGQTSATLSQRFFYRPCEVLSAGHPQNVWKCHWKCSHSNVSKYNIYFVQLRNQRKTIWDNIKTDFLTQSCYIEWLNRMTEVLQSQRSQAQIQIIKAHISKHWEISAKCELWIDIESKLQFLDQI